VTVSLFLVQSIDWFSSTFLRYQIAASHSAHRWRKLRLHLIVLLTYALKELYLFLYDVLGHFVKTLHIRKCLNLRISHSIHTSYCLLCCVTYILARKLGIDRPITCNVTSGRTGDGDCMMDGWFTAALSQRRFQHQQINQGGESLTIT